MEIGRVTVLTFGVERHDGPYRLGGIDEIDRGAKEA
jgi:hypothetical protein